MKKFVLLAIFWGTGVVSAQKMTVIQGDSRFLKEQKEVNVEFVYDNYTLLKEQISEEVYIEQRSADLNQKTATVGDTWVKKWNSSKELIWEPKFLELLNVVHAKKKKDIRFIQNNPTAKYTLIVKTVWIYPGWDAGIMKQAAKVSTLLYFVATDNRDKALLTIRSVDAPGNQFGNNYSNESRIGEGYAKTAKTLAGMLLEKSYK
ncbi:hypothetical protein [Flavobacterium sp. JP2137]|uniref:hypothetical protein n=1 Tax=Flavobacterium sp. JP2137 TaxID=3414510 RepID=UPI003D2FE2A2